MRSRTATRLGDEQGELELAFIVGVNHRGFCIGEHVDDELEHDSALLDLVRQRSLDLEVVVLPVEVGLEFLQRDCEVLLEVLDLRRVDWVRVGYSCGRGASC